MQPFCHLCFDLRTCITLLDNTLLLRSHILFEFGDKGANVLHPPCRCARPQFDGRGVFAVPDAQVKGGLADAEDSQDDRQANKAFRG